MYYFLEIALFEMKEINPKWGENIKYGSEFSETQLMELILYGQILQFSYMMQHSTCSEQQFARYSYNCFKFLFISSPDHNWYTTKCLAVQHNFVTNSWYLP